METRQAILSDPLQVNTFLKLYALMVGKAIPKVRKIAFDNMLKNEEYDREGDVLFMRGSKCSPTEKHTAAKLTKAGYYVVFPSKGQVKAIKKLENTADAKVNDVYIYDKKTYYQSKVDLKTVGNGSTNTVAKHIVDGSEQATTLAIDIQGHTNRWNAIKGIRLGLAKCNAKRILLNWKGQWYQLTREQIYSGYLEKNIN